MSELLELNLQFFGGRGSSSNGGATGGVDTGHVLETTSLISQRETKRKEVDDTLTVLRDVQEKYGAILNDVHVAKMDKKGARTMAYYDSDGNLAVTEGYFDSAKMDAAYDRCVQRGFHPKRGKKSGMEAAVAHECGHKLTAEASKKMGLGEWPLDKAANKIVRDAAKKMGVSVGSLKNKVSGYATRNNMEAIAEAFSDVYCNGSKASKESKAIVEVLNGVLGV